MIYFHYEFKLLQIMIIERRKMINRNKAIHCLDYFYIYSYSQEDYRHYISDN